MTVEKFSNAAIESAVNKALEGVSSDAKFAVVAHADQDQARLAAMVRLGDSWYLAGYLDKPYIGKLEYGAELKLVL